jgi:putative DNA primase/helicase
MKLDIATVAKAVLAAYPGILAEWLPAGRMNGHEYRCGDLGGAAGDSLSINTRTGAWADFASDARGGDPVSLYAAIHRLSQIEAARELAVKFGLADGNAPTRQAIRANSPQLETPPAAPDFKQIIPSIGEPPATHKRLGKHVAQWDYRTAKGELIGYIRRYDTPGGKEIVPVCFGESDGRKRWAYKGFADPRPLFNLPDLVSKPTAIVLLVEGEKAATAARTLFPKLAVLTWPGGSKAVRKADFSPLNGRRVVISPDHDEPGYSAAAAIAEKLKGMGCDVKFAPPAIGSKKGWDWADFHGSPDEAFRLLKGFMRADLPNWQPDPEPPPVAPITLEEPPPLEPDDRDIEHGADFQIAPIRQSRFHDAPFKCLGFERENMVFFSQEKKQLIMLTASAMTTNNLLTLASKDYWLLDYRKSKKSEEIDAQAIADHLIRECYGAGIFNHDRIRGRGAWMDGDSVAVHLGDKVMINGEEFKPGSFDSRYIYEAATPIGGGNAAPLSTAQANRLLKLMDDLAWTHPMASKLAAGWCVVAHIGGVLKWRPHIWIIGAKGSGKSYVMTQIIKPLLNDNCLMVLGGTSEAGLRQQLGYDSIPVLFDEAESEDQNAQAAMQRVLGLIRQSSSETGGRIAKGTPGGKAQRFLIRSCFALSSINAALIQQSDKSRVTVVEISPYHRKVEFEDIQRSVAEIMTPEFVAGFYARAIQLAPVIRKNAATFARAAAAVLGEQRAGDQIGALLAGAYSLFSSKVVDYLEAETWMKKQDWTETKEEINSQDDALELYQYLLEQKLRVRHENANYEESCHVGYLIDIARGAVVSDGGISIYTAKKVLQKSGFKIDDNNLGIWIASKHADIATMLKGHKHSFGWREILKRYPGAICSKGAVYFTTTQSSTNAVLIPFC